MSTAAFGTGKILKLVGLLVLFFGLWFTPVPRGLTLEAWHLFAVFASAIVSVVLNVFPLSRQSRNQTGQSRCRSRNE